MKVKTMLGKQIATSQSYSFFQMVYKITNVIYLQYNNIIMVHQHAKPAVLVVRSANVVYMMYKLSNSLA